MKHKKEAPKVSNELDKEHVRTPETCQEHAKEDLMEEFVKAILTMNSYIANKFDKEE